MARADSTLNGITRFGGGSSPLAGVHVQAPRANPSTDLGILDQPGVLLLDAVADTGVVTTNYLWVDSAGKLRIHTAYPTNQDADGTVVGQQ